MESNNQLLNDITEPRLIRKKQTINSGYGLMKEPIIFTDAESFDEISISLTVRTWNKKQLAVCKGQLI